MSWLRRNYDSVPTSPPREPLLPLPVTASNSNSASASSYPPPPQPRSTLEKIAAKGKGRANGHSRSLSDGRRDFISSAEEEGRGLLSESGTREANEEAEEEEEDGPMVFGIRFTDGQEEDLVSLWVGVDESVRDVQRRIRILRPSLTVDGKPRRLRLIQLGRLLTDGTKLVPYARSLLSRRAKLVAAQLEPTLPLLGEIVVGGPTAREKEKAREKEAQERARAEKGKGREREREREAGSGSPTHERRQSAGSDKGKEKEREEEDETVWLHCSVGEPMDEEEAPGEKVQTTQITPLQGFDRLRDAGFSEEEIASMRAEFRASTASNAAPVDGDADEHARALEDQWMEGLTGQNEAQAEATTTGVYTTLLMGTCVGFFLPFLPLFFFRTQVFSTRMQMAIVLGMGCNLVFALLRAFG